MPIDKNKLSNKQLDFVQEYCKNGHIASKAYKVAYPDSSAKGSEASSIRLLGNVKIKRAIDRIEEDKRVIATYDRQLHIKNLNALLTALSVKVKEGNISAIRAANSILSEIGASTGLHSQTINTDAKEQQELTDQQEQEAKRFASIRLREMA